MSYAQEYNQSQSAKASPCGGGLVGAWGVRGSFVFLFLLFSLSVFPQGTPIFVTPILTPPHSLTLSDYVRPGAQNLVVNVMVNDVTVSNLPVRLHFRIESTTGVVIENIPTMATTPIFLNGGQALVLFGEDLADYFNVNNLNFRGGISREQYRRTGQLPEGFYRFTVEVRHFNTGRRISNQGSTMAWIAMGQPPQLRLPLNDAELGQFAGIPLTFSWQPAPLSIPNAGTQYLFEMWEMRIPGIPPYVVANTMPVFYSTTQAHNTLVIQPAAHFFEPGMRYAWRVTAFDPAGRIPFAQNGRSEIRTFTFQSRCDCPTDFTINRHGRDAAIRWQNQPNHTSFFMEVENPDTDYFRRFQLFDNRLDLHGLHPGSTYNIRIQAVCNNNEANMSDFTTWQTFTIPEPQVRNEDACPECVCQGQFPDIPITNFTLRNDLQPGDTIQSSNGASRFIIKTVEQQSENVFRGHFLFWWEFFNVKILSEYWDLSVNTDNVIVNFDFESVYDPRFLIDVDNVVDYINNLTDAIRDILPDRVIRDTVEVEGTITDIFIDENGNVVAVITHPDGTITEEVRNDLDVESGGTENNNLIAESLENVSNIDNNAVPLPIEVKEKEFELTNLTATDRNNTQRVARAGEFLYFIDKQTIRREQRGADFKITYTPANLPLEEINPKRIQWIYNGEQLVENNGKYILTKTIRENDNVKVSVNAGNPAMTEKSVDIQWISAYDVNADLFQQFNMLIVFMQEFNNISRQFGRIFPCEVNVLRDFNALRQQQRVAFNVRLFNEENPNNREVNNVSEVALVLNSANLASFRCSKRLGIGPVSLGNIYISAGLGTEFSGIYRHRVTNETETTSSEGEVSGDLFKLTLRAGLETNPELQRYFYATANLNISAGAKTIWPYRGDRSKVGSYFYVGNTNLTIEGHVDSWLTGGRRSFDFNWVVLQTSWRTNNSLIIDLANGKIYTKESE